MSAVEDPGADRILHAESADHGARRKHIELETVARHLVDAPRVVLRILVEDVFRGPGALEPPRGLRLRGRDRGKTESCSGGGARRSLQELAPRVGSRGNGLGRTGFRPASHVAPPGSVRATSIGPAFVGCCPDACRKCWSPAICERLYPHGSSRLRCAAAAPPGGLHPTRPRRSRKRPALDGLPRPHG